MSDVHEGDCLCRAIRYRVRGDPLAISGDSIYQLTNGQLAISGDSIYQLTNELTKMQAPALWQGSREWLYQISPIT
jgi:hypothetical protein